MNSLILTHKGLEETSAQEIKQHLKTETKTMPEIVLFNATPQQLAQLTYTGRTFIKVTQILHEQTFTDFPKIEETDYSLLNGKTITITCDRDGEHDFKSVDVIAKATQHLKDKFTIDRKNATHILHYVIRANTCYTTIDYSGIDLGKRDYRIFLGTNSIKGTLAAGLLFISEYKPQQTIIDPFCRYGTIPIEAALLATNTSSHKFEKEKLAYTKMNLTANDEEKEFKGNITAIDRNFKHVNAAKKNAKIATINKHINFSRIETEWFDMKFDKKSVDAIITYPLQPSNQISENTIKKVYEQIITNSKFILKKTGTITLLMRHTEQFKTLAAKELKLEKEIVVYQGQEKFTVLKYVVS